MRIYKHNQQDEVKDFLCPVLPLIVVFLVQFIFLKNFSVHGDAGEKQDARETQAGVSVGERMLPVHAEKAESRWNGGKNENG